VTAQIRHLTIDCTDWRPLVAFWAAATDFTDDPDNPNEADDPEGLLISATGMALLFIPVPEPKRGKNRLHLDLVPVDGTLDEEVARLTALGASVVADHRRDDGTGWVTMADPEGNEFCVERSESERSVGTS
jgi:catechol 2,3-dioxygenase-like lactoylglutathione lyase family enzyme